MNINIKRGGIYMANLDEGNGSIQGGNRPIVVIQNDIGSKYPPTFIGIPVTSKCNKRRLSTHKVLEGYKYLISTSTVIAEQIMTINKTRLVKYIGDVKEKDMIDINKIIAISLALC